MRQPFNTRHWLIGLLGLAAIPLFFLGRAWKHQADLKGQAHAEPFRVAGNLYYVGANDISAFLLTGPDGDVLIGGGYPTTAPLQASPNSASTSGTSRCCSTPTPTLTTPAPWRS